MCNRKPCVQSYLRWATTRYIFHCVIVYLTHMKPKSSVWKKSIHDDDDDVIPIASLRFPHFKTWQQINDPFYILVHQMSDCFYDDCSSCLWLNLKTVKSVLEEVCPDFYELNTEIVVVKCQHSNSVLSINTQDILATFCWCWKIYTERLSSDLFS